MGNGCSGCNGCNGCGCGGCNGYGAQMYEDLGFNGYVPQHAYYQERGLGIFLDEMSEKTGRNSFKLVDETSQLCACWI